MGRIFDEEEAGKLLGAVCADCLSHQEAISDRLRDTADLHEGFVREGQVPAETEDYVAYRAGARRRLAEEALEVVKHKTPYRDGERQL